MKIPEDQLRLIPEPYKTFLQTLWPVVRSAEDGSFLRVSGVPSWMIHRAVADRHGYTEEQFRQLAQTLESRGWVAIDAQGFYVPKGRGVDVLRSINQPDDVPARMVPELPNV